MTSKHSNATLDNRTISEDLETFIDRYESIVLVAFGGYLISPKPLLIELAEITTSFKGKVGFVFAVAPGHRAHEVIEEMGQANIHLVPQTPIDLLSHAKLKLWITHCGASPSLEAIYHGVPLLGFPITPE